MESASQALPLFVVDGIVQRRLLVQTCTSEEAIVASRHIASSEWVPCHSGLVEVFPVDSAIGHDLTAFYELRGPLGEVIDAPIAPPAEFAAERQPVVPSDSPRIVRLVANIVRSGYQPDSKQSKAIWLHALSDYATRELRSMLVEAVVAAISQGAAKVAPEARFAIIAEGIGGSAFTARPTLISSSYFPPSDSDGWREWNRDAVDWPDTVPPLDPWILDELAAQYASSCEALVVDLLNKRIESFY